MCKIISLLEGISSILFQLYDTKARLFEGNLFWVGRYDHPNFHTGRRTNPISILIIL